MSERTQFLFRWSRTLHIYLTMFASVVLFLFALTGFMLNHAELFGLKGKGGPGGRRPAVTQPGAAAPEGASPKPARRGAEGASARPAAPAGVLSKLTSLHKGKPKKPGITWLIDITAFLLMLGSITGIILLLSLPRRRKLGLIVMGVGTLSGLLIYLLVLP